jgi:hypothetical protein
MQYKLLFQSTTFREVLNLGAEFPEDGGTPKQVGAM